MSAMLDDMDEAIDYRALLKRYLQHVLAIEGTTFTESSTPSRDDVDLTADERRQLDELLASS